MPDISNESEEQGGREFESGSPPPSLERQSKTTTDTSDTMIVHEPSSYHTMSHTIHLHELGSENNSRIPENDVISAASENSWFSFMFEASSDEHRFDLMCYTLSILTYAYTFCACANFTPPSIR